MDHRFIVVNDKGWQWSPKGWGVEDHTFAQYGDAQAPAARVGGKVKRIVG